MGTPVVPHALQRLIKSVSLGFVFKLINVGECSTQYFKESALCCGGSVPKDAKETKVVEHVVQVSKSSPGFFLLL